MFLDLCDFFPHLLGLDQFTRSLVGCFFVYETKGSSQVDGKSINVILFDMDQSLFDVFKEWKVASGRQKLK